jgi:hypothetical protein
MNIKIQGGGNGSYANTGSCSNVIDYLQHEDLDRALKGETVEPFFNQTNDNAKSSDIIAQIDKNKSQLHKSDARFFVVTISPSSKELKKMGDTPLAQSQAMKEFVKNEFIEKYAENFNKNLSKEDILYYSKIHIERKGKNENDLHAHVVISRKTADNKLKISPKTNHRSGVMGGFDRTKFFDQVEKSFDSKFKHQRDVKESFEYQNAMKNGSLEDVKRQVERELKQPKLDLQKNQDLDNRKKSELKLEIKKNRGMSM